jgi:GNAT superfamily N-acetyltransferase
MRIRQATIDDSAAISDLIRPLAEKYIAREFSPEGARYLPASMEPAAIKGYLESGYQYHVAEQDGVIAGAVAVRENKHVYHLFVAEPFQGRGLARRLWHVARDACRQAGNPGEFTVNSSRFAVEMYRKFGFVETGPPETKSGVTSVPMKLTQRALDE